MGTRKFKGFVITSILLTIALFAALAVLSKMIGVTGDQIVSLETIYIIAQGSVSGAFFGANWGEHVAKSKVLKE